MHLYCTNIIRRGTSDRKAELEMRIPLVSSLQTSDVSAHVCFVIQHDLALDIIIQLGREQCVLSPVCSGGVDAVQ